MKNKIIYSLSTEDIQNVATDILERELTTKEIESIIDLIADKINWYDVIADSINEKIEEVEEDN